MLTKCAWSSTEVNLLCNELLPIYGGLERPNFAPIRTGFCCVYLLIFKQAFDFGVVR